MALWRVTHTYIPFNFLIILNNKNNAETKDHSTPNYSFSKKVSLKFQLPSELYTVHGPLNEWVVKIKIIIRLGLLICSLSPPFNLASTPYPEMVLKLSPKSGLLIIGRGQVSLCNTENKELRTETAVECEVLCQSLSTAESLRQPQSMDIIFTLEMRKEATVNHVRFHNMQIIQSGLC